MPKLKKKPEPKRSDLNPKTGKRFVSQETVDAVRKALAEKPLTARSLADATGRSLIQVDSALKALRAVSAGIAEQPRGTPGTKPQLWRLRRAPAAMQAQVAS